MNLGKWIGFFAFLLSLYILWQIRQVLLLIFAAVVLANALSVLVKRFHRSGMKRGFAVLLSVFLLLAIFVGFFLVIVPPFASELQQLNQLVPRGIQRFSLWIESLQARLSPQLNDYLNIDRLVQQLQPFVNQLLGGGFKFFSSSLGFLGQFLLVIVLTLMLLVDPEPYRKSFIRLFPSFYRHRVDEILDKCEVALRGWLLGILFNMSVIASLSFVGLIVLRIPLALAQAALAGILTFIPNIGPAVSVIPPMAIALLEENGGWKAIAVLIFYVVIQQVESNFLTPYVMAQQVSLLPAVTLLAQVFFATFFGFLGLFLALPLTVVAQVWLKETIIIDVLDRWQQPHEQPAELAIVSPSTPANQSLEASDETITEENPANQDLQTDRDRLDTDDFNKKV